MHPSQSHAVFFLGKEVILKLCSARHSVCLRAQPGKQSCMHEVSTLNTFFIKTTKSLTHKHSHQIQSNLRADLLTFLQKDRRDHLAHREACLSKKLGKQRETNHQLVLISRLRDWITVSSGEAGKDGVGRHFIRAQELNQSCCCLPFHTIVRPFRIGTGHPSGAQ